MVFKISNEAENDLAKIWNYTFKNWSIDQADRYVNLLFQEIEYLSENPLHGKDVSYIRKGYLRSKVKSHFIFYKIGIDNNQIEIIRILHEKMDIKQRIEE